LKKFVDAFANWIETISPEAIDLASEAKRGTEQVSTH